MKTNTLSAGLSFSVAWTGNLSDFNIQLYLYRLRINRTSFQTFRCRWEEIEYNRWFTKFLRYLVFCQQNFKIFPSQQDHSASGESDTKTKTKPKIYF